MQVLVTFQVGIVSIKLCSSSCNKFKWDIICNSVGLMTWWSQWQTKGYTQLHNSPTSLFVKPLSLDPMTNKVEPEDTSNVTGAKKLELEKSKEKSFYVNMTQKNFFIFK